MAYELRYTLTQILQDSTLQVVNIYEKDYVGIIKTYEATSILVQPNSNEEDAVGDVISSELKVSFLISTEDDYAEFPDLLNYDDTFYYVELLIAGNVKWKGFLFNDYIQIAFTTGNQVVNIVCVDGLSLIKYNNFYVSTSINQTISLLDLIGTCLYNIGYKNTSNLYACCSYYAEGMLDRGDAPENEPFKQSYIFIRDVIDVDYYTILRNIVISFGCRLFQSNGDWYIMPINDMASTIYYTKYSISSTPTVISSGTLSNLVNIQPYTQGNIHFVNNSQTKIVRKGYQVVESTTEYSYAPNYIHNGTFKYFSSGVANGWTKTESGTSTVTLTVDILAEYNYYNFVRGASGSASIQNVVAPFLNTYYAPKMYGPGATLSFDYEGPTLGSRIKLYVQLVQITTTGTSNYYLRNDKIWDDTIQFIDVIAEKEDVFESKNINIPLGYVNSIHTLQNVFNGYVIISFVADTSQYNGGKIKNVKLKQSPNQITALSIKRQIGESNVIVKSLDLPIGLYHPPYTSWDGGNNNYGALFNQFQTGFFNGSLKNWYRYGFPTEQFYDLHNLLVRQYSNLLNKNIASLEGDLGNYNSANGLTYLDKTYTIEDASTNALSYNGKKFLANRLTLDTYNNEVDSIQLIEITNLDNESVEKVTYIGL